MPVEACDRMLSDSVSYCNVEQASESEGYIYTVHTRKVWISLNRARDYGRDVWMELGSAKPNSKATYDDHQISHTRGDTMVTATNYLSNASSKVDSYERYM